LYGASFSRCRMNKHTKCVSGCLIVMLTLIAGGVAASGPIPAAEAAFQVESPTAAIASLPASTIVAIRTIDLIDSAAKPTDREYMASLDDALVIGNVTAIAQTNLKRMLAYSTIAQIGFLLLAMLSGVVAGDTLSTANAYSAAMFYAITYAFTSLGTFGMIMLLAREGFEAEEITDFNGLNKRSPWYAFVMLLLMFSLAGIPPTVGFYAKLVVLQALLGSGMSGGFVLLAVLAVLLSVVGAFYYVRVVKAMYFEEPTDLALIAPTQDMHVALSANGALIIVLGIAPQYLLALCANAMIAALGG